MDLYKYLCFILLTTVCYIDAEFIFTKKEYTWSQANRVCTLAAPHLSFSKNGITPNLATGNLPIANAWLGYTEKMTPFEYFGCAKTTKAGEYTVEYITEGDPGKCWSACNYVNNVKAVAVHGNECYCLDAVNKDLNKLLKDKCDIGCPSQPNIVCGGVVNNDGEYVSLYKTIYTGPINISDSENNICLWYDQSTTHYFGGNCTENYRMICYKDRDVWLYNGSKNFGSWTTMTTRCFSGGNDKRRGIPSSYKITKELNTSVTAQMWTGLIRNGVIYPITNTTNVTEGKYGYINISTGQLLFTNDSAVKKRALCVEGSIVEAETTTSTGSSDVGAIVGASLAIIIVIIVVVVLVVLWKRGMKFPFKKARQLERENTQATNMTYNFVRPDNTIQGTAESSFNNYAEVDVSKMTPGTGVTQNGDANRTSDSSNETHPYIVLEKGNEGTYDTTKTTPQIHDQHTFNPYNEISLEESSNYDHIGAHVNDSKTLGLGNPYNSTTLASSNKYNGLKNNAFNRNDDSDDTYNHIDGQLLQTELNQSDNPYNTTALGQYRDHNLQNDYGGTNIAFNSNDECDDTYNHIGDQPGQND